MGQAWFGQRLWGGREQAGGLSSSGAHWAPAVPLPWAAWSPPAAARSTLGGRSGLQSLVVAWPGVGWTFAHAVLAYPCTYHKEIGLFFIQRLAFLKIIDGFNLSILVC